MTDNLVLLILTFHRHGKIPTLKISLIQIFRAHLWQKSMFTSLAYLLYLTCYFSSRECRHGFGKVNKLGSRALN